MDKTAEQIDWQAVEDSGVWLSSDDKKKLARRFAAHRLAALSARPAGDYVLVPREPTEAMIAAGDDYLTEVGCNPMSEDAIRVYRAMIAARPATLTEIETVARPADRDMVEKMLEALEEIAHGDDLTREDCRYIALKCPIVDPRNRYVPE